MNDIIAIFKAILISKLFDVLFEIVLKSEELKFSHRLSVYKFIWDSYRYVFNTCRRESLNSWVAISVTDYNVLVGNESSVPKWGIKSTALIERNN